MKGGLFSALWLQWLFHTVALLSLPLSPLQSIAAYSPPPAPPEPPALSTPDPSTGSGQAGLYRTTVTLRTPADWTRLEQLGVVVLERGSGGAGEQGGAATGAISPAPLRPGTPAQTAVVLADADQLEALARLRFDPRRTDELGTLVAAHAQAKPWLVAGVRRLERGLLGLADQPSGAGQPIRASERSVLSALAALTSVDDDADGLTNTQEQWWCTDALDDDTDGDGTSDGTEVQAAKDWLGNRRSSPPATGKPFVGWPAAIPGCPDDDNDDVPDLAERWELGLNMNNPSTDRDRYSDGMELFGLDSTGPMSPIVRTPGNHPFVAAYPVIHVDAVPGTFRVETVTELHLDTTVITGTAKTYGTAETRGTSDSVMDMVTWNEWQEVSVSTPQNLLAYRTDSQIELRIDARAEGFLPPEVGLTGATVGFIGSWANMLKCGLGAVAGPGGVATCIGWSLLGHVAATVFLADAIADWGDKINRQSAPMCTVPTPGSPQHLQTSERLLSPAGGSACLPGSVTINSPGQAAFAQQRVNTSTPDLALGGSGTRYTHDQPSHQIKVERYYPISYPVYQPVPVVTETRGRSWGGAHAVTHTEYQEHTISQSEQFSTQTGWTSGWAKNTAHAADLTFSYRVSNVGTDYARSLSNMIFNVYIGRDPNPAFTCQMHNPPPDRNCNLVSLDNVFPGDQHTYTTGRIWLSFEQMKALDLGGPIFVVVDSYSLGDDDVFFQNARQGGMTVVMDDGVADGDESLDVYVLPTWEGDTVLDVLARYFPARKDAEGNLLAISTPEWTTPPAWIERPLTDASWFNLYLDNLGDGSTPFRDTPARPNSTLLMRYQTDSDRDGYTDRSELRLGTHPNDPASHPSPGLVAGLNTTREGDVVTGRLAFLNTGNYDAYGVEAIMYAPDQTVNIGNNTIGGGGRVKAASQVVLGSRVLPPGLANWRNSTARPYSSGSYAGNTDKVFTFTAESTGAVGSTQPITLTWDSGPVTGTLTIPAGYQSPLPLDVTEGVQVGFYTGSIIATDSFTVGVQLPRDTFTYTVQSEPYTPPGVVVSYNDPQGNHRFITPVELSDLSTDLAPYQSQMLGPLSLEIATTAPFTPTGSNTTHYIFNLPDSRPIVDGHLFVEYVKDAGTVVAEQVFTQTLQPGPNIIPVTWDTGIFTETYQADHDYNILALVTDWQGNIIQSIARPLSSFQEDPRPAFAMSDADETWDFGTVTQGELLEHTFTFANTGFMDLFTYLASPDNTAGPESTRTLTSMPTATPTPMLTSAPTGMPTTCVSPPSGLISWWPGDGSANDIVDGNHGAILGGATFGPGMVGQAVSFDGVDDSVRASTTGFPTGNIDRTMELWVWVESFGAGEAFFAGYGNFGSNEQSYHLGTSGSTLFFSQWGNAVFGPSLETGRWYHVAVTNMGNSVVLYLDGTAVASGQLSINTPSDTQVKMGKLDGYRRLHGLVDEIGVYNRALNSAEIADIFNAGREGKCKTETAPTPTPTPTPTTPPLTVTSVSSRRLTPGDTTTYTVTLDTSNLLTGPYTSTLTLRTSDPAWSEMTINVSGMVNSMLEEAVALPVQYRPWDQTVYIPDSHPAGEVITFTYTISPDQDSTYPLYVYDQQRKHRFDSGGFTDLNHDGFPDIVFGNGRIYWGSETGFDGNTQYQSLSRRKGSGVRVADLNKDGYQDIVLLTADDQSPYEASMIYWGSSTGYSTDQRSDLPTRNAYAARSADLNKDGYIDLVVTNRVSPSYVYWGSATGYSVSERTELETLDATGLAVSDLNADGYLDIVIANMAGESYIYWGGTNGYSTANRSTVHVQGGRASDWVSVADLDEDGYKDLVFSLATNSEWCAAIRYGTASGYDGGRWTALYGLFSGQNFAHDFNRDGYLDILFLNTMAPDYIYWGSASGFSNSNRSEWLFDRNSWHGYVTDLNNDGYLDFVTGWGGRIYWGGSDVFNTSRRLILPDGDQIGDVQVTIAGDPALSHPPIVEKVAGTDNVVRFVLPETITTARRYVVQFGDKAEFASAGSEVRYASLPKQRYAAATMDILLKRAGQSDVQLALDIGTNGSTEWSHTHTFTGTIEIPVSDFRAALNAYMDSATPDSDGMVVVPISVGLNTSGELYLTNFVVTPASNVDLTVGDIRFGAAGANVEPTNLQPANRQPATVTEGDVITVTATISNTGTADSGPLTVAFFATPSGGLGETYIGAAFVSNVPAGGTAPAGILWNTLGFTGDVPVRVVIDPFTRLTETDEDNNEATTNIIILTRPDLQISNLQFSNLEPVASQPVTVSVTISNAGQTDAGTSTLALYACPEPCRRDGNPESDGRLVGEGTAAVPGEDETILEFTWAPPAPGLHRLFVVIDREDAVDEFDEGNNQTWRDVYVGFKGPILLDSGTAGDTPYTTEAGYGYVDEGIADETVACGDLPHETLRVGPDGQVVYRFDHLLPGHFYHLDVTLYKCNLAGRQESIYVDGNLIAGPEDLSDGLIHRPSILLDPALYANRTISVTVQASGFSAALVGAVNLHDIDYRYADAGGENDPQYPGDRAFGWLNGTGLRNAPLPYKSVRINQIGNEVQYQYDNLVPGKRYRVNLTFWQPPGSPAITQAVQIDGANVGAAFTINADQIHTTTVDVPPGAYATDGSIVVGVVRTDAGDGAIVNEIALEEKTLIDEPPTSDARLYLDPSSTSTSVNQTFTVDIVADTGSGPADTVDAYINFDPTYLEVVDASGAPTTTIELNTDVFSSATANSVDNTTGEISFSATKLDGSMIGSFTAATIRFRAKAEVDVTEVIFVRSGARVSDLYLSGEPLNATLENGSVRISRSPMLRGRVALERRGEPGDPRWVTELFRVDDRGTTTCGVRVYEAGTTDPLAAFCATTDAHGRFSVELPDIESGTNYTICIQGSNTLSNKKTNISLPSDTEIDFGTLLVGDSNGDDRVNGADVSYMVPSFLKCASDPDFRPYADTNRDGCINGADVSALVPNFLKVGACAMGSGVSAIGGPPQQVQLANGAGLSLSPSNSSLILANVASGAVPNQTTVRIGSGEVAPGGSITIPLEVLNVKNLASVEIEVRYDPNVLRFIACSPDPNDVLDLALCEEFDDDGVNPDSVRFTAVSVAGVSGSIVLSEVTFEAVGQPGGCNFLDVEVFTLDDTDGNPISHSVKDGQICISGGTITIVKEVVGQAPASNWQFNGTDPIGDFTLPANGGQRSFALSPGSYTITEIPKDGYNPSASCTSGDSGTSSVTVNLDAGENVICTFTNTPIFTPTPGARAFLPLIFHQSAGLHPDW